MARGLAIHCDHPKCNRRAYYNYPKQSNGLDRQIQPATCRRHLRPGMINVCQRICRHTGCGVIPSFNRPGEEIALYCVRHKSLEMVDVVNRKCSYNGCNTQPSYRWAYEIGHSERYCAKHYKSGMVIYRKWKNMMDRKQTYPLANRIGSNNDFGLNNDNFSMLDSI